MRPTLALAALALLAGGAIAHASDGGGYGVAPRACGGDAWSYAIARDRSAPDGRYAIGPQTHCAEVAREERAPLGPIGIVVDPFSDGAAQRRRP